MKYLDAGTKLPKATLGWSGGAMMLGKLPVPGRPTNLDKLASLNRIQRKSPLHR